MSNAKPQHAEWLNKNFFEKVIKHFTKDEAASVREFAIQSGSKPGESFASDLLRASINYATETETETKSISVILKVIPRSESGDIDAERMMKCEMKMYGQVLIDINRVLLDAREPVKLFPR